jgi:hypothetical protein
MKLPAIPAIKVSNIFGNGWPMQHPENKYPIIFLGSRLEYHPESQSTPPFCWLDNA